MQRQRPVYVREGGGDRRVQVRGPAGEPADPLHDRPELDGDWREELHVSLLERFEICSVQSLLL